MHLIKTRSSFNPMQSTGSGKAFVTGSGLHSTAIADTKPAPRGQNPPSTRQLARNYAAFHGMEGQDAVE